MHTLQQLVEARVAAKREEDSAVARRRALDQQIIEAIGDAGTPSPEEGTISRRLDGLKVTVTYGLTRKVDVDALRDKWAKLPEPVQNSFRWKAEVSVTEMRKLDKDQALAFAKFVTSTPATPSVKIDLA